MAKERNVFRKTRAKLGLLISLVAVVFLFSGCDGGTAKTPGKKLRIGLMITPKGLNDMGFNDLAFGGLKSAAKKFDIEPVIIEPSTMKDPEASLRFFAAQTFDAIIAVGVAFHKAIQTVSKEHPQLSFFVIDSSLDEGKIKGISFREDEGSFLCGYLAGNVSKSGKIGFIGGVRHEVILRFLEGYKLGAGFASSSTAVIDRFIAEDFSGFNRPEIAKKMATELFQEGCDIVYHAAGASGLGVISAAVDAKKFAIGADMNQDSMAPGLVLTSMLKRVDFVVEDVVKALSEGKSPDSIKRSYGLSDNAIDLTDFQFSRQIIGEKTIKEIGELKQKISAGMLKTTIASSTP